MEFIKKLKNSFNIGAEKALDTSDVSKTKKIHSIKETSGIKQEIDEREPKIEYREIIINDSILYLYRNGRRPFVSGCLDIEEDKIIIYRYKLDEKIKLNSNISFDRFLMEQQKCKDAEFRVLEHEKKHWKNHKFGVKEDLINNLVELSLSYAFDEISAFAQSNLYGVSNITEEEAQHALMMGVRDFMEVAPIYLDKHFEKVLMVALLRKSEGKLKDEDMIPFVIDYSWAFKNLVKNYLTFGNVCCYDLKRGYYANEINQNLYAIKYKYKEKIAQITRNSLGRLFLERNFR